MALAFPAVAGASESSAHVASGANAEPKVFYTHAKVEIGAGGEIASVVAEPDLGADIGAAVERYVRGLSFSPAAVDGIPVSGTTFVRMMGCAAPLDGQQYRLAFAYNSHGPGYTHHPYLPYPAHALRAGVSGILVARLTVQADGTARLDEVVPKVGGARAKRAFGATIESWVATLRYQPEHVAGKPVATPLSLALEFDLSPSSRKDRKAEEDAVVSARMKSDACQMAFARERGREPQSIAIESPFLLKAGG